MVLFSLKTGISMVRRNLGLCLGLLAINFLIAVLLTIPFYRELIFQVGNSLMGRTLLDGFSLTWLAEFRLNNELFERTMGSIIFPAAIIYIFLWSVLSGGIIELFRPGGEGGRFRRFLTGVSRHFFPFLRLTVISSIIFLLVYWLLEIEAWSRIEILLKESPYPRMETILGVGITLFTIAVLLFIDMIFDYARIKRVIDGFPSVTRAIFGSLKFCFRNLPQTLMLYASLLLLSGILILIYLIVYNLIPQNSLSWIITLFLVQESFMLLRIFIRVATYSCQMDYYINNK
jgi:hypothetical protein